jgi:hypothetical protein
MCRTLQHSSSDIDLLVRLILQNQYLNSYRICTLSGILQANGIAPISHAGQKRSASVEDVKSEDGSDSEELSRLEVSRMSY